MPNLFCVDVLYQFVKVLVPRDGGGVVEVRAHRHDDVVAGVMLSLVKFFLFYNQLPQGANIAQWICLRLTSCCPGFESSNTIHVVLQFMIKL